MDIFIFLIYTTRSSHNDTMIHSRIRNIRDIKCVHVKHNVDFKLSVASCCITMLMYGLKWIGREITWIELEIMWGKAFFIIDVIPEEIFCNIWWKWPHPNYLDCSNISIWNHVWINGIFIRMNLQLNIHEMGSSIQLEYTLYEM